MTAYLSPDNSPEQNFSNYCSGANETYAVHFAKEQLKGCEGERTLMIRALGLAALSVVGGVGGQAHERDAAAVAAGQRGAGEGGVQGVAAPHQD